MLLKTRFESRDALLEKRPKIENCLQCAVCPSACMIKYVTDYDPRNTFIYHLFQEDAVESLAVWGCPACHKCVERCPYDFKPLEVVRALKEAAFLQGLAPPAIATEVELILSSGAAFPIGSLARRQRARLGLSELKLREVEELQRIAQATGLIDKMSPGKAGG